jgi:hypothetical protein
MFADASDITDCGEFFRDEKWPSVESSDPAQSEQTEH